MAVIGRIVAMLMTEITIAARIMMIVAVAMLLGVHLDERLSPVLAIVRG